MKETNYKEVFETIVSKTYEYIKDNKRKTMVLGISGGIDSTVTAAICYEIHKAHPEIRFIGLSLPCSTNMQDERASANDTMAAFCSYTDSLTVHMQKMFSFLRDEFEHDYNWLKLEENLVALGNIKARLRMMYLYNIAGLSDGLVMDTDNLTEHYLGFWTIHGDVGDFNPIGGLWKHEVYGLAKWLANEWYREPGDAQKVIALRKACTLNPTDGNGVAVGGDLAQIAPGLTYDQVDDVLMWFLDPKTNFKYYWENFPPEKWPAHVFGAFHEMWNKYGDESVNRIIKRHMNSEFKRKRMPIAIEREEYKDSITDKFDRQ